MQFNTIGWYVFRDDRVGSYNDVIADVDTAEDGYLVTNPYVISDDNLTFRLQRTLYGRYGGFLQRQPSMGMVTNIDEASS